MAKVNQLSEGAKKVYEILKANGGSLTIAEIKEKGFTGANSSHLVALRTRGYLESEIVEREVPAIVKKKVNLYTLTEKEMDETE